MVDPLERVLPQELRSPWLAWFATRPQAIGELGNSLPAEQDRQADFGIQPLEHAARSQYLLAWAANVNAPLDLKRKIIKNRILGPVATLEQPTDIINNSTVPLSDEGDLRALWTGTFPSLATVATLSLMSEIPDPIPEVPAAGVPPSALLQALQPAHEQERPAVADLQFSFKDSPPPSPNREIGHLRRQLEEASKQAAMDSDAFYHFLQPLINLQMRVSTWEGELPKGFYEKLVRLHRPTFTELRQHPKLLSTLMPILAHLITKRQILAAADIQALAECFICPTRTPPGSQSPRSRTSPATNGPGGGYRPRATVSPGQPGDRTRHTSS